MLKGEDKKEYQREYMRKRRLDPIIRKGENMLAQLRMRGNGHSGNGYSCEICGYSETIDLHHEGEAREEHWLCPNHHALITRGIKTLDELRSNGNGVRPKPQEDVRPKPQEDVRPKPQEDVRPKARYEPGRIGIPIKPTQAQRTEWAKFKQGKST